ncbi:MAG: MBL fold metallo-hydrolase [Oligoflexia bacterium]|nr:MBL fold metallo-hydrolase [Oligoflexia bacterium]
MDKKPMVVTILGCGTSVGSPMIGRQTLPQFKNPKNHRLRSSLLIEPFGRGGPAIVIDTSPDFREQALRYFPTENPRLDAVLLTHTHADHLHGLDDIRPFNFYQKEAIPLYSSSEYVKEVERKFSYIFLPTQEGGGKPRLELVSISKDDFTLKECSEESLKSLSITPLFLRHGSIETLGYRIGSMAYATDCSEIPENALSKMKNLDLLFLDCLRPKPHTTHMHVDLSLEYARKIGAKKTIFIHMNEDLEYEEFRNQLPEGIEPAYDGMRFEIPSI